VRTDCNIPELEGHIEALRERQEADAREAEFLWPWLAKKEIEFYRLRETAVGLEA
jgi:hypothetical protein